MDIAKYIGQYILKNNFCYIHGLGNMELVKRPAVHDGKSLQGPSYEVIVTAGGSIDDSFANFIAVNEQISISKAANALREFSIQARKDLASGKEVLLPNLGKFYEENGKVKFITDSNFRFTPAGIPTLKNSKQLEEQKVAPPPPRPVQQAPATPGNVNWSMVIIAVVLLVILACGGYGYYYYKSTQKEALPVVAPPHKDTVYQAPPPVVTDTVHHTDSVATPPAAAAPAIDSSRTGTFRMVIGDYTAREKAEKRLRQLKINGNHVELITKDSANFLVLAAVNCRIVDTTHAKDSLIKLFGYKNVSIYK